MYDPDGRAWSVRRRISPRIPAGARVFDWVDLFGSEPRVDDRGDRGVQLALGAAAVVLLLTVVAPQLLARGAPVIALLLVAGMLLLGRVFLGVPTIIEAWRQAPRAGAASARPSGERRIVVRARGWRAGPRAERDVCAALREGYDFG